MVGDNVNATFIQPPYSSFCLLIECVEMLISLTKTDILLSKERFKNVVAKAASRFTPLNSRESFKNLSAAEKKVRRAQQFGVQLMPGLGAASFKPATGIGTRE